MPWLSLFYSEYELASLRDSCVPKCSPKPLLQLWERIYIRFIHKCTIYKCCRLMLTGGSECSSGKRRKIADCGKPDLSAIDKLQIMMKYVSEKEDRVGILHHQSTFLRNIYISKKRQKWMYFDFFSGWFKDKMRMGKLYRNEGRKPWVYLSCTKATHFRIFKCWNIPWNQASSACTKSRSQVTLQLNGYFKLPIG